MNYVPNNVTDCISEIEMALDKSLLLLGNLTTEYSFCNRPMAILETANKEARKWVWEYNRIITFLDIALDYAYDAKKILERAMELDNDRRKVGVTNE